MHKFRERHTEHTVSRARMFATGKTVTKLRASDGLSLGTFKVGDGAAGIAFDGTNVWVVNNGDSTVMRLSPSSGKSFQSTTPARARFPSPLTGHEFGCELRKQFCFGHGSQLVSVNFPGTAQRFKTSTCLSLSFRLLRRLRVFAQLSLETPFAYFL